MKPIALPALLTPFDDDGALDLAAHRGNIETVAGTPALSGALLAGSTGQGPLLDPGERLALVETARRAAPDMHLMVGVMAESTASALAQVEEAARGGADEVLVLPPVTLARNDVAAQERFLTVVADRSPIPVLVYSVPRNTGYHVDPGLIISMADHPNVVGLKDSGGDLDRIAHLLASTPDEFRIYNGASRTALGAIRLGCAGLITASGNYAPKLVERVLDGDEEAQEELTRLSGLVESLGIGGITTAARLVGSMDGGIPRAPLQAVAAAELSDAVGSPL